MDSEKSRRKAKGEQCFSQEGHDPSVPRSDGDEYLELQLPPPGRRVIVSSPGGRPCA